MRASENRVGEGSASSSRGAWHRGRRRKVRNGGPHARNGIAVVMASILPDRRPSVGRGVPAARHTQVQAPRQASSRHSTGAPMRILPASRPQPMRCANHGICTGGSRFRPGRFAALKFHAETGAEVVDARFDLPKPLPLDIFVLRARKDEAAPTPGSITAAAGEAIQIGPVLGLAVQESRTPPTTSFVLGSRFNR